MSSKARFVVFIFKANVLGFLQRKPWLVVFWGWMISYPGFQGVCPKPGLESLLTQQDLMECQPVVLNVAHLIWLETCLLFKNHTAHTVYCHWCVNCCKYNLQKTCSYTDCALWRHFVQALLRQIVLIGIHQTCWHHSKWVSIRFRGIEDGWNPNIGLCSFFNQLGTEMCLSFIAEKPAAASLLDAQQK